MARRPAADALGPLPPGARVLGLNLASLTADAPACAVPPPGPWVVEIDGWNPPSVNVLMKGHWAKRAAVKKAAVNKVAAAIREAGVPVATGRRRVLIQVFGVNRSHLPDPDNVPKSVLDGIKRAGAIIDDKAEFLDCPTAVVQKADRKFTRIVLEDID